MATLSANQTAALDVLKHEFELRPKAWHSAYDLQQSMATLNALHKRCLIDKRYGLGSMAMPRNGILYRFKPQ